MGFYTANGLNWMSSCSVVFRAYNETAHIGRLLEGLSRQTLRDLEVILVDSGSTDSTAEQAATTSPTVVHIPPEEFTFGRSLNFGLAKATCEPDLSPAPVFIRSIPIGWSACWNRSAIRRLR